MKPATPDTDLPGACQRVADAASAAGLDIAIHVLDQSSRTAEEAAEACGTTVERIVKSLVFAGKDSGTPILLLVSGNNRVKENLVGRTIGEKIVRPDAAFVREKTGFAIGGIPPLGHAEPLNDTAINSCCCFFSQFSTEWCGAGENLLQTTEVVLINYWMLSERQHNWGNDKEPSNFSFLNNA